MTIVAQEKIYRNGVEYSHPKHVQFIKDMDAAGIPVELKHGYLYSGPAARIKDGPTLAKITSVGCKVVSLQFTTWAFPYATCDILNAFCKANPFVVPVIKNVEEKKKKTRRKV